MYEFNTEIDLSFNQAVARVRDILMEEHLGVVSDVDVQAILKNKLDKDIPPYHIFGACNPALADRVIQQEPNAGTLLPCNFIIRERQSGKVVVSFMVLWIRKRSSDCARPKNPNGWLRKPRPNCCGSSKN